MMSSKLNKIAGRGKSTFTQIEEKQDKFRRGMRRTDAQASAMKSTFSGLNGVLTKLGIGFGIFEAVRGVGSIIKLGSDMEQTRISFETMLGSAEKATKTIQGLNKFSNATPFNNKEVIQAGRNLLAFGVSNEKLIPTLRKVGDISAGLKIPFNELSEIYGKIKVQNTVYSEDLNQLAGRGIPIFTELAKVMGVAPDQIKKLASEGKITFPFIERAFTNMTGKGGQFFNLMEKQSKSFGGKWSTFMGKLQLGATKLGEKILPNLMPLVDWGIALIEVLPQVGQWFNSLYSIVSDNALVFGLLGVALLALNANFIISKISFLAFNIQFRAYVLWTKVATTSQWLWNAALTANPIGLVIAALAALVAGVVYAYQKIGWFRGAILAAWEYMKGFGVAIKELVVDRIKDILKGITGLGKALMQFFKGDWKAAWETGKSATANLMGANSGAKFFNKMKGVGKKAGQAYSQGVAEVEANKEKKSGGILDMLTGKGKTVNASTEQSIKGASTDMPKGLSKGIDTITGGGSKQTNINVTFGKLVETFTIQSQNVSQGMSLSEDELKRMLLRVLNSINQLQTTPV
ncbi:tape measure domain-containing protein [Mesonia hippocampi]|uniref:Tape measure domain-containing protein n=1 Tax=Mesonia hippocampi TaxID=1628250 RepID=A0A840EF90_9FLAO|nr:tape measure protein [Mesonia hippocampi]MBB4117862.1 tape measure domain-containing protein [Mesonia hippocampi]